MPYFITIPDSPQECKTCRRVLPISSYWVRRDRGKYYVPPVCSTCETKRNGHTPYRVDPIGFRYCSRGDQCLDPDGPMLSIDKFGKQATGPGGLRSQCRACHNAGNRKNYNPDKKREYQIGYSRNNKDKLRAKSRRRYEEKSEHINAVNSKWRKNNPDKIRAIKKRRRAREANVPSDFLSDDWKFAINYFGSRCAVCGDECKTGRVLSSDHWIPITSPDCPGTVPWNIVPLCHGKGGCNGTKAMRDPLEWLIDKFGDKKGHDVFDKISRYFEIVKDHHSHPAGDVITRATEANDDASE